MSHMYFDCPGCGYVGRMEELNSHPTRPIAEDLGFCPHCQAEVYELESRSDITGLLISYDEDPEKELEIIDRRIKEQEA